MFTRYLGGNIAASSVALITFFVPGMVFAESKINMPVGITQISREVYDLHMLIFWVCCGIGALVFGVMFYSVFKHRKAAGHEAAQFHHSTAAEIVWTLIPFIILVLMAIPAAGTLIKMEDASESDMTIKATGYQWKWQYTYIDEDIDFFSMLDPQSNEARQLDSGIDPKTIDNYLLEVDKPLVVPVHKKVRLLLTSNDVIHAWWVPALGGKKDAIPGFINEMWFKAEQTGIYRGQCAELCGRDHGFMPIVVNVVTQKEYDAWVAAQTGGEPAKTIEVASAGQTPVNIQPPEEEAKPARLDMASSMEKGEKTYNTYCSACHKRDGSGTPPAFPSLIGSQIATGDLDGHINMVLNGKPGTAMAPFKMQLNDEQIATIITYERNAWGNDTGDVVQPEQIKAAR